MDDPMDPGTGNGMDPVEDGGPGMGGGGTTCDPAGGMSRSNVPGSFGCKGNQ
jgi:hypothetical protein